MSSPCTAIELPDRSVRERVTSPSQSSIVQAPAGSGKTELLTQRFLRVLAEVDEPESVLAITFTRKASSEMRNRILASLEDATNPLTEEQALRLAPHRRERRKWAEAALTRDRLAGWNLLLNPHRLQIKTVDSFCETIVRSLPLLSKMSTEMQITEDPSALYEAAANRTIELLASENTLYSAAITELLRNLSNDVSRLRDLFVSMLQKRDQWMRILGRSDQLTPAELENWKSRLEESLASSVSAELEGARAQLLDFLGPVDAAELMIFASVAGESENERLQVLQGIAEFPAATPAALPLWRSLKYFVLSSTKTWRKQFNRSNGFSDPQQRERCKQFFERLASKPGSEEAIEVLCRVADKLPDSSYSSEQWCVVKSLLVALPLASASLKVIFAEQGVVDFMEVAQSATAALQHASDPSELALALGAKVRHILVDEFQDTSKSQLDLLLALTAAWDSDPDTSLFVVGDPMQSIYAFREAEVTLFTRAFSAEQIGGSGGPGVVPERLKANFRSSEALVEWFNDVFPRIFGRTDELTGSVEYSPAVAVNTADESEAVVVRGFGAKEDRAEAEHVAQAVKDALDQDANDNIAILVRARPHLVQITEELRKRGVTYRAVDIDVLSERQIVRDLDALSRAIVNPADRTAWLAVLRSPYCGLILADLWILCRQSPRHATIPSLLRDRISLLSADGAERAARATTILGRAARDIGKIPLRLIVERAWMSMGGPAALSDDREQQLRDAGAFFEFLQKMTEAGVMPGTNTFCAKLNQLYSPAETMPDVRVDIMTIHGAKGLEWDVVFLPCLGKSPQSDQKELLYWRERVRDGVDELLLAPMQPSGRPIVKDADPSVDAFLCMLSGDRSAQEAKRLLYVAATRARKRLHLTATLPKPGRHPRVKSLLNLLWEVTPLREQFLATVEPANEIVRVDKNRSVSIIRRLPSGWKLPRAIEAVTWSASTPAANEGEVVHTFEWAGETRRIIGTVTHAFLQEIARSGLERWNSARIENSRNPISTALLSAGVSRGELPRAIEEVILALRTCMTDERGRWILSRHGEDGSEMAVTSVSGEAAGRIKVDRTFIDNGTRWIVDFKITQIEGGDAESYFAMEVEKYRKDLARYAAVFRKYDARPVCCGLYFPLQGAWRIVDV